MSGGNGRYSPLLGLGKPARQPTLSDLLSNGLLPPETRGLGVFSNGLLGPEPTNPFATLSAAILPSEPPGLGASLNGLLAPEPMNPLAQLSAAMLPVPEAKSPYFDGILSLLQEKYRARSAWNACLSNWSRPASDSEEATIERARSMVDQRLRHNEWLRYEDITIASQGSYHNNTNVRREADIDLRAVHPTVHVEHGPGVVPVHADNAFGYTYGGPQPVPLWATMRKQIVAQLIAEFGANHVDASGKKAIRLKGVPGSRADVDVVPSSILHYVTWNSTFQFFERHEGIAILSTDGKWTLNFPEQHHANGKSKRERTRHRFKRIVRIFKHLRTDMKDRGIFTLDVPSFLIECLVYAVDDRFFLYEEDDLYDRVKRIAREMQQLLRAPYAEVLMYEINGVKLLFGAGQSWTPLVALAFANAVFLHLGDA